MLLGKGQEGWVKSLARKLNMVTVELLARYSAEPYPMRMMISYHFLCLHLLVLSWAPLGLVAAPLQHEVPYFVDTAGAEFDPGQQARDASVLLRLPESQRYKAALRSHLLNMFPWRINLKSDGTWEPDLNSPSKDYADRHYPVEYVLPAGYRGGILMVWSVPGAPPVQIVNNKIEVYFPATGVYETSTPPPLEQGTVASIEHAFYFEHDGERTRLRVEPLPPGQVGVIRDLPMCPKDRADRVDRVNCFAYFVGTDQELSAKCSNLEEARPGTASGHDCFEISPGSTQPVSDLVPPKGTPAPMANKFQGRTSNGRPVVLSANADGTTLWQYDGPEPVIPRESTLVVELKSYIEALLTTPRNGSQGDLPESTADLLKLSASGPYRFVWSPFSGKIAAQFFGPTDRHPPSRGPLVSGLMFVKREQGWTLDGIIPGPTDMSKSKSDISRIIGRAMIRESTPVVMREDGTWELEDANVPQADPQRQSGGYDLNGNRYIFETAEDGRRTWHLMDSRSLPESFDSVASQVHKMLERGIELLSEGNIEAFLANGGTMNSTYEFYRGVVKAGDDSPEAREMYELFKENPEIKARIEHSGKGNEIQVLRQVLLEGAVRKVDVPSELQRMKSMHGAAPRILQLAFSPDFEAVYTLPHKCTVLLVGHGSAWTVRSLSDECLFPPQ